MSISVVERGRIDTFGFITSCSISLFVVSKYLFIQSRLMSVSHNGYVDRKK
jgi:hypothetical protein